MPKRKPSPPFSPKAALRKYREARGLSADQAGSKVDIAGTTWRSYENGWREVDGDMAKKMEEKCGIPRERIRRDLFLMRAAA